MKTGIVIIFLSWCCPMVVLGGEIFGHITEGGKPVMNAPLKISAPGNKSYDGATDKFGAYRISIREKGKCTFNLTYRNQTVPTDVHSSDTSVRYDLVLEKDGGRFALRRK